MWLMAIAIAIIGSHALQLAGLIDLGKSFYVRPNVTWLSYALGYARYTDRTTGETFWGDFDQRHTINVYGDFRVSDRLSFSARSRNWISGSQSPRSAQRHFPRCCPKRGRKTRSLCFPC